MNPEASNQNNPGHEVTSWRSRPFVIGVASFFIFMGVMLTIVGGLAFSWTHHLWPPGDPLAGPESDPQWDKKLPQLQINGPVDLQQLNQREYQRLHAVRWTDASHAYAAIPIERAMALMVQAESNHQLNQLLPEPKPSTPVELQNQKSGEGSGGTRFP